MADQIQHKQPDTIPERIIGKYTGSQPGPLLIVFGGMHGNEPAGVIALETIFGLLEAEREVNPGFTFCGTLLGLRGNRRALNRGVRFIDRDLNRMWTFDSIMSVQGAPLDLLRNENLELRELLECIHSEVEACSPSEVVMLDLHTTAAQGGIFSIAREEERSVRIAVELHAPVITGMLNGLTGTTLHYFTTDKIGLPTSAVAFEGGQHQDPVAVNRLIAALTNCLRTVGCVRAEDVENRHDVLLREYSKGLPKVASLIYRHAISPEDYFLMNPGYSNFQAVKKGEAIARDRHGVIRAAEDALILMPLYQKLGDDGFFLIRPEQY